MKLITMPESIRKRPRGGMIKKNPKEGIQGRRTSSFIQLQAQAIFREIEVKMEWSIHSGKKHTIWSSNTED